MMELLTTTAEGESDSSVKTLYTSIDNNTILLQVVSGKRDVLKCLFIFIDGPTQVYKESCENPISTIALSEKSIVVLYLECRLGVNYLKLARKDVKVKRNNGNFSFRLLWRFKFAFFTSAVLMLKDTFSIWTNLGNCKHLLFVCFMCLW